MGRLYIAGGSDAKEMARLLLDRIKPEEGLSKDSKIALKPNLVVAKPWKSGATTNPAVCEAVIEHFHERGFENISIIESSWLGCDTAHAFRICGYEALAKKYGAELVDVKKDGYELREFGGFKTQISKRALGADCIINLPLMKGHCQTKVTCAIKNLKGLVSDREKRRFHAMGLHKPIACLGGMIRPALTIADGIYTDPGFEEGGSPRRLDIMIAGTDSVLIDAYAAKLLGYRPYDIEYIRLAHEAGLGSADIENAELIYVNGEKSETENTRSETMQAAKAYIEERDACSACCANLLDALMQFGRQYGLDGIKSASGRALKERAGALEAETARRGLRIA